MEGFDPKRRDSVGQEDGMVPEERRGKQEKQVMSVPAQPLTRAPRPPAAAPEGMPLRQPTPTPPPPLERTKNTATKLSSVDAASSIEIGPFPLSREHKERDPLEIREGSAGGSGFNISGEWVPPARAGEPRRGETANYYSWREVYPELEVLVRGMADIVAECDQVAAWKAWPEKHYDEGGNHDWKVFPFMHTFPAYDESRRTWVESTCTRCPATTALLRRLPNIRTALFSRLGSGSRIAGHQGWADLANHVLRCHLPLRVPSDGPCGLWVDGEIRHHAEGEIIVFDDSKMHKAFNDSTGDRLVLIVDMLRPSWIPLGIAEGEHTPELDAFIDAFR